MHVTLVNRGIQLTLLTALLMQYLKAGDRAQRSVVEHYYKTQHKAKMPRQPGIRQLAVVLTIADSPKIVQSGRIIKCPRKRHNCALSTLTIRPG